MRKIGVLFVALSCSIWIPSNPIHAEDAPVPKPEGGAPAPKHAGDLRIPDKISQGDLAPDFNLKTKEGNSEIVLSSFRGKKPVVLIFGSYT